MSFIKDKVFTFCGSIRSLLDMQVDMEGEACCITLRDHPDDEPSPKCRAEARRIVEMLKEILETKIRDYFSE